ncbi:MAG TPA: benzoate-CoA ligase family protein [Alphaproteobacteria bacterium]
MATVQTALRDHTVHIGPGEPQAITFAPVFNTAVPFIDRHLAEGRGGKDAIRTMQGSVSYAQLAANVNRAGNALGALGLQHADRVLMVVKDCPEFFYVFWGAIKAGFVPVPLNTLFRAEDFRFLIADSGCAAIVYSPEYAAEVTPALDAAKGHLRAIAVDELAQRMATASADLAPARATADDDCFWLYSSGSTGKPKGAVHRHRDMLYTCIYYAGNILKMTERDVVFSAAKLFFAYGHGNAMTFPLWFGATAVLAPERPTPEMTFDVIARFKPTLYFGVPTLYAAQLRAMETAKPDLSSLRLCVSAGEALPAELFRRWKEKTGVAILDGIGSTEIMHIFISNRIDDVKPGTTGKRVPGYALEIRGEDGKPVKPGESGTLWVGGKSIAKYYWNNAEKTAATIRGEWINTGDTYTADQDGYYIYGGRSDDMMKVGGIWCSPFEIEGKLVEHPKVFEAAVVARTDRDELVKPAAYIVLKDAKDAGDASAREALQRELLEHCKSGLAPYKYPRWFEFVPELPKTATGKIQRFKLRQT